MPAEPADSAETAETAGAQPADTRPAQPTRLLRLGSRPVAVWVAVAVAVAGVVAITLAVLAREGNDGPGLDPAVEQLIPAAGSEVLVQQSVGLDLVDGTSFEIAELRVNGTAIAPNEWQFSRGTNRLGYQVGDGQTIEQLRPERNCVAVKFYPTLEGPASARTVSWCFNAS